MVQIETTTTGDNGRGLASAPDFFSFVCASWDARGDAQPRARADRRQRASLAWSSLVASLLAAAQHERWASERFLPERTISPPR